jgi:phosphatidylinositol alpha-1,6-mannosyltransferase
MKHLLVTNDFPPKIGGIQSLLWEWWRRLPPDSFAVLTSPYDGAEQFDAEQPFLIRRTREPWLLPHPFMVKRINEMVREVGADIVVLDPAVPLGIVGPYLDVPYDVVLHGAEVTVPGRLPISRALLSRTLRHARHIVAAGGYPAREAERAARAQLPITVVQPGVDIQRFHPLNAEEQRAARDEFGISHTSEVVLCVSRLVPRKGFDTVIRAAAQLSHRRPDLQVIIASSKTGINVARTSAISWSRRP